MAPIFLPAGGTNTFIFAMAGNVASVSNTLFDSVNQGESAWLSCTAKTANADMGGVKVCTSNYAKYDNGAGGNVFTLAYANFAGTSLPSILHLSGGTVSVDNVLYYTPSSGGKLNTTPSRGHRGGTHTDGVHNDFADPRAQSGDDVRQCGLLRRH